MGLGCFIGIHVEARMTAACSVQRQRKFAFQADAEAAISLGSGQDALKNMRLPMGVLVRVSLVGVSQLGLLSLDHKDVKFLWVAQAEAAALAAIRTLDATDGIASMNLELANYYSICFRNLQVSFYSSAYL